MSDKTPLLSTGDPSTLGTYIALSTITFGQDSPATQFLIKKANEQGLDQEVLADEGQMIAMLFELHVNGSPPQGGEE
jgi:hypothetical protein